MQYRKTSVADVRHREEKERQECTFHPKIIDNPFVSEKTLRKYGEATPASAMLRKNKRTTSPSDRRNGPELLAGMYTAAGGLNRGPPEKPGIPMYYFNPFSPPNFATGTYGAPQVITQIIQKPVVIPIAASTLPPLPAAPTVPKIELKAPPLPPWLGKVGGGGGKPAGNTVPKLVIQKKDKPAAAEEPSGWQAVLLEMQRRANKRNGGDGGEAKEKEKKMEPPKPQPKPKRTLGKKKEFKDPVEELKYKFALKRGEIQEDVDDDDDDGEEEGDGKACAAADAKPAAKKVDIAAMLAKRNAPAAAAAAATPAPVPSTAAAAAAAGNEGSKAVNRAGKKIPLAPPIPSSWPPQPSKEVIKPASATAQSTAQTTEDTGGGKKSGFAGAAAALMAALANRGKSNTSNDTPAADTSTDTTPTPPAIPAATSTSTSTGSTSEPPVIITLKPGEAVPEGVEARTATVPGSKLLPDGYYLAANSPHILVAPYEILPAGETTVSLILQLTAQMDPENAFQQPHSPHNDEDDVLIDQLSSQPGDHNIAKLSRRLTASDLPVPAGYVQAVSRMQRNAQQRQQKLQELQQLELRNYTPSLHNASTSSEYLIEHTGHTPIINTNNSNVMVDLSFLASQGNKSNNSSAILNSLNSNSKALQTSQRLYSKHTKAFQQYTTITQTTSNVNNFANTSNGSDEHKGLDFGGTRWFQSLRSSSTSVSSSSTNTNLFHQSFGHTSSFNHTTSNSLHVSQLHLQQTQQHLLNQSQISATQPKDPNFLTDSIVARRQRERAAQQQLQAQEEQNKLLEQKRKRQEQLLKLKKNLSLRYETLQVKAKKYQKMLQSHRKQLPTSVRADVEQKLQLILKEMEDVSSQITLSHSHSTTDLHQIKHHQDEKTVVSHTTTSAASGDRFINIQPLRPRSAQPTSCLSVTTASSQHHLHSKRFVSQPPAQPITPKIYHHSAIEMDNNTNNNDNNMVSSQMPVEFDEGVYYYADFPSMPLLSPYHPPQPHVNTHRYGQNECTFEDDQDVLMYYEQDDGYDSQRGYGRNNQQLNHYNFQQYNSNIDNQEDIYFDYS